MCHPQRGRGRMGEAKTWHLSPTPGFNSWGAHVQGLMTRGARGQARQPLRPATREWGEEEN